MPSRRFSTPPWCPATTRSTPRRCCGRAAAGGRFRCLPGRGNSARRSAWWGSSSPGTIPLNLAITDAVPALMAGNTGVLKPDPQTSFTALWAVELLREAGLPPDVLPVVTGEGPVHRAGSGRSRRLRDVHRQRADREDRRQPGGGTPDRVFARAGRQKSDDRAGRCRPGGGRGWRRDAAASSAPDRYAYPSSGFTCTSPYSMRSYAVSRNVRRRCGWARRWTTPWTLGSLASVRQLEAVEQHVRDALEKGATLPPAEAAVRTWGRSSMNRQSSRTCERA